MRLPVENSLLDAALNEYLNHRRSRYDRNDVSGAHDEVDETPKSSQEGDNAQETATLKHEQKDPKTWSALKKGVVTCEICFITAAIWSGTAILTAGHDDLRRHFRISRTLATFEVSIYLVGTMIGTMVWGPLSELPSLGRSAPLAVSIFGFLLLQIPTALATDYGMLLVFRFLAAIAGAAVMSIPGACVSDMYEPRSRAYAMCFWDISIALGPSMSNS